jgi:redox-sensitive bicupin YhaK (pirin superfamily)
VGEALLVDAEIDDLENVLVTHECLVGAFLPRALFAVRQNILSDFSMLDVAQGIHEIRKAFSRHEQGLEVLVWVFDGLGRSWG